MPWRSITPALAAQFARSTLGHVGREYPHALVHIMDGPESISPRAIHPIFYGSFDWHSCVHGWWQLLRLAHLFPALAPEIQPRADAVFTAKNVEGELAYLRNHPSFERPYGWAWILALHGEASRQGTNWSKYLEPLARLVAHRLAEYLPRLTYPVRTGSHSNTAFALIFSHEWANQHDPTLAGIVTEWAEDRFWDDRAAAHQEPSGEDFLSPTLTEAVLMSRILTEARFDEWFSRFLPELPENLKEPAQVSDRSDGRIGHLDGLNLSRSWCLRSLGRDFGDVADRHLHAALPHLEMDYMGEHWLATFALLALTQ